MAHDLPPEWSNEIRCLLPVPVLVLHLLLLLVMVLLVVSLVDACGPFLIPSQWRFTIWSSNSCISILIQSGPPLQILIYPVPIVHVCNVYVGMIVQTAINLKSHVSSKPDFGIRKNPSILICDIFPAVGSLPGRRTPRCRKECTSTRTVLPPENSGCKRWRYWYLQILHPGELWI